MRKVPSAPLFSLILFIAIGCGSKSESPVVSQSAASPAGEASFVEKTQQGTPGVEVETDWVPGLRRPDRPPLSAPSVAIDDPELQPLVSYLKAEFAKPIKEGRRLIFDQRTTTDPLRGGMDHQQFLDYLLANSPDEVPPETIRDFCEKNRTSREVGSELTRHLPAEFLTRDNKIALFKNAENGWKQFYMKYPDAYGCIHISRVGLNRDKTVALIYVGVIFGGLNGHGQLHVLKKKGDTWIELPVVFGVEWVS